MKGLCLVPQGCQNKLLQCRWQKNKHTKRKKNRKFSQVLEAVLQSCPTLCNTMDGSLPGSSVHGILQARILEWVAVPSSRGPPWPRDQTRISCISSIGRGVLLPLAIWEARSPKQKHCQGHALSRDSGEDFVWLMAESPGSSTVTSTC